MTAMLKRSLYLVRGRFEAMAPREQGLIAIASCLALAVVFSTLIWRPLAAWRQASLDELRRADLVLTRVAPLAGQRLLVRTSPSSDGDLAGQAAAAGLQIQSLEPEGANVRVRLENAPFARLIPWIDGLDQQGAGSVITARLERGSAPGLVDADLLIAGRAP